MFWTGQTCMPLHTDILSYVTAAVISETFWTAIGSVGTVAALFLIYRQVKHARYVSAYEFLRREDDRFRTEEMMKHRRDLATALLSHPEDFRQIDVVADFLLDYFEDLGLLVRKGLAPGYLVWSMTGYYVLRYWHALLPYINWVHQEWKDNTYYSDFEYLYGQVSKMEKRQTGKNAIEFTDSDLRNFLNEELAEAAITSG